MKNKAKHSFNYIVDQELLNSDKAVFLIQALEGLSFDIVDNFLGLDPNLDYVFFIDRKNSRKVSLFKNKILVVSEEADLPSSLIKINLNSLEEILDFLKKIQLAEKVALIKERARASEQLYEDVKKFESSVAGNDVSREVSEEELTLFTILLDLELALMQEEAFLKWNEHLKVFCKKQISLQSAFLMKHENFHEENLTQSFFLDEASLLFKLPYEDYFLCLNFKSFIFKRDASLVDQLISIVIRVIEGRDQKLVKGDGEIDLWKKVFSKIPYPMALISDLGDLLIYNESFAKIGILPKECLRFKDLENTEIFQSFYKIRRIDFSIQLLNVSYFVFYTVDKNELPKNRENSTRSHATTDELGIISSSIAHELNNPLAGILAALSLLSLEDDWSHESLIDLEDMKSGARRCKELVEIFLGFSRFSPTAQAQISIQDSLDQAINLLRFRMIESNLRLDIKYSATLEKFAHQINSSVMSMIFYLISNELMTAYAHHRLVTMALTGALSGEVLDFSNQIVIRLDEDFEYEEKIAQSKLIQHLLIFEKLEINFLHQEIRLIYRQ